jgi:hypothetical protein
VVSKQGQERRVAVYAKLQGMGLEVNNNDERYNNLINHTQAACEFILNAKAKVGSWTLAAFV